VREGGIEADAFGGYFPQPENVTSPGHFIRESLCQFIMNNIQYFKLAMQIEGDILRCIFVRLIVVPFRLYYIPSPLIFGRLFFGGYIFYRNEAVVLLLFTFCDFIRNDDRS